MARLPKSRRAPAAQAGGRLATLAWIALGFLVGCGGSSVPEASDLLALRRGVAGAGSIELHVVQALVPTAEAIASEVEGRSGLPVEVLPLSDGGGASDALRVLVGRVDEPAILAVLERFDVDVDGAGFGLLERRFEGVDDALVLDVPDADRPGLLMRIVAANSTHALRRSGALLAPADRPGFSIWRGGAPVLGGGVRGSVSGTLEPDLDREAHWEDLRASRTTLERGGLAILIEPGDELAARAEDYLLRAERTRRRALDWAGVDVRGRRAILFAHSSAPGMQQALGCVARAWLAPVGGALHLLLEEGLPDDHGRELARAEALRMLGPPAEPWLLDALADWATGQWWGRPLDRWVARLHAATLAADVAELTGRSSPLFGSPHRLAPQRAFFLGWLLEVRGADYLRDLWDGRAVLEPDEALELGFHRALEDNRQDHAAILERKRTVATEARSAAPPMRGAHLIAPGFSDGLLSADADLALQELLELGANAVSFGSRSWQGRVGLESDRTDEEVILFARRAARSGLSTAYAPQLLVSPSGDLRARAKMATESAWERFFAEYTDFALHQALLAELAGVDLLAVGDSLGDAVDLKPAEERALHRDDDLGRRLRDELDPVARLAAEQVVEDQRRSAGLRKVRASGWEETLDRVRRTFDGPLTYVAASPVERLKFDRWRALDRMASWLLLPLSDPDGADLSPEPTDAQVRGRLKAQLSRLWSDAESQGIEPLLLGVGFPPTEGAWSDPSRTAGASSGEAARRQAEGLVDALDDMAQEGRRFAGLFLWCWHVDPARRLERARGFDVRHGRSRELLTRLLGER